MTNQSHFASPALVLALQAQHPEALQSQQVGPGSPRSGAPFLPSWQKGVLCVPSCSHGLTPTSNDLPSNHLDSQGESMASEKSQGLLFSMLGVKL